MMRVLLALVLCICVATAAEAKKKTSPTCGSCASVSWYGLHDGSGSKTASGTRFSAGGMTVAHRNLPFGTKVLFTNPRTGSTACGVVRDRGPFVRGRSWDVSYGMARKLGFLKEGVAPLSIRVNGC